MGRDRVLVIGGTGFIGRILVEQLLDAGCDVRVMSRAARAGDGRITYVRGEVADREALRRAVEGMSVVYDLSMGGGPTWQDYLRDFVQGAQNVAETCLDLGVRRLIYSSTIAALQLSHEGTTDESAGTDPKPLLRSWYSRGKIYAEDGLMKLHRERRLPVVVFRPGIVVGRGNKLSHPGIGVWRSPTCCEVVGRGRTPLPLVLVDDVARALVLAKDAPDIEGRTFNLVGDVRLSAQEYVDVAGARSLRNFRLCPQSMWGIQAFRLVVWLGKAALRRRDNEWLSYHELKTAPQKTHIDCTAAKRALGWQPIADRDEFVRRAIDCHIDPPHPGDIRLWPEFAR
jgi:nucleoside-diphosphate-sugar epimerase